MKLVPLLVMSPLLVSCLGGNSGGSGENAKVSLEFVDSTVSNFQQTSGLAKAKLNWHDYLISRAFAGTGNISCIPGQAASFSFDVTLGGSTDNLVVDTTCGADIELKIRRKMLAALDGHRMILEVAGGGGVGSDYVLEFTQAEGFQFDIPFVTLEDVETFAGQTQNCYIDYTFNSATGRVSSNISDAGYPGRAKELNLAANLNWGITEEWEGDPDKGQAGCNTLNGEYRTADFRFKDGKIEMDESGTKRFNPKACVKRDDDGNVVDYQEWGDGLGDCSNPNNPWDDSYDSPYERWCIDDNSDGVCDV